MIAMSQEFVCQVQAIVQQRTTGALTSLNGHIPAESFTPGKMLRTRLAGRLLAGGAAAGNCHQVRAACAAIELVHTASLCHDDVMDNSFIRRSVPTLWQAVGTSGAILIGDLLLWSAVELLAQPESNQQMPAFIAKVKQVVQAEAEQELCLRGTPIDVDTCLRLARDKTGPLFAFPAMVCGGQDEVLSAALEEAGYRIGTAYQLADDLLDVVGDEAAVGKTLGTDRQRGKETLPQAGETGQRITFDFIKDLCKSSLQGLENYPKMRDAIAEFLTCDFEPALNRHLNGSVEMAV